MPLEGSITGQVDLAHLQELLHRVPEKLRAELTKGVRTALAPLEAEVKAAEEARMPQRFGPILAGSTKVTKRVTGGDDIKATVKVSAKGISAERDVRRMNLGELRHPVFGRYRMTKHGRVKNPWSVTTVVPGMVDEPMESVRRRAVENAQDARDRVADMLLRE